MRVGTPFKGYIHGIILSKGINTQQQRQQQRVRFWYSLSPYRSLQQLNARTRPHCVCCMLYATAAAADGATLAGAGATLAATRIRPVSRQLRARKAQIHFVCE